MDKFFKYLYFILKNTALIICFVLDIVGALIVYFGNLDIPQYVFYIVLMIGFIISNYRVYIENSPEINISISRLREYPFKALHCTNTSIDLMVSYNLYINNFGNNVGIVEDIQVELVKFCNIKDKFLLDRIDVGFSKYFVSNIEIFAPLEFMKNKEAVKFPIIIEPRKTENKILILYLRVSGSDRDDYIKTFNWINDFEFKLLLTVKNNNVEKKIKYQIILSKQDVNEYRIKEEESNIELEQLFETSNTK